MIDPEIRVAIAKVCGWTPKGCGWYETGQGEIRWLMAKTPSGDWGFIPDYPNDLNAMHEAEKILTASQQLTYAKLIHDMFKGQRHYLHKDFDCIHTTARQRCKPLLKTLNLWRDD